MRAIRRCPDHGHFAAAECPECGGPGERVLSADRRERLSKFLSGALRHFPEDVGLDLDRAGWASEDALVRAAAGRYPWADAGAVAGVIATDPKGRFERREGRRDRGDRVRAAYGHSVDVDLDLDLNLDLELDADRDDRERDGADDGEDGPDRLYHGTAPRNVPAIREEGLKPMDRQAVHLSPSVETARAVGRRHAPEAAVFAVDAAGLRDDGVRVRRRGPETYTADRVPPDYLSLVEGEGGGASGADEEGAGEEGTDVEGAAGTSEERSGSDGRERSGADQG